MGGAEVVMGSPRRRFSEAIRIVRPSIRGNTLKTSSPRKFAFIRGEKSFLLSGFTEPFPVAYNRRGTHSGGSSKHELQMVLHCSFAIVLSDFCGRPSTSALP